MVLSCSGVSVLCVPARERQGLQCFCVCQGDKGCGAFVSARERQGLRCFCNLSVGDKDFY